MVTIWNFTILPKSNEVNGISIFEQALCYFVLPRSTIKHWQITFVCILYSVFGLTELIKKTEFRIDLNKVIGLPNKRIMVPLFYHITVYLNGTIRMNDMSTLKYNLQFQCDTTKNFLFFFALFVQLCFTSILPKLGLKHFKQDFFMFSRHAFFQSRHSFYDKKNKREKQHQSSNKGVKIWTHF